MATRSKKARARAWVGLACFALACTNASRPPVAEETAPGPSDAGGGDASPATNSGDARPPGTWCAAHPHAFCEDFDDPGAPLTIPPGGALESANVVSAPNAFASKTAALAANAYAGAQLQFMAATPLNAEGHVDATFAFDVRLQTGTSGRFEIARVKGVNPIDFRDYGFAIVVSNGGASIELGAGSKQSETKPLARAPAQGKWEHVSIHLGMNVVVFGPTTSITVQIGDGAPETFSLEAGMGVRPFLYLGAQVSGPAEASEIDYDNVTYDVP